MQNQLEQLEKDFSIEWQEYAIGDLFDIRPTKNYGLSNGALFSSRGNIPVVSNTGINNGITAYVDLEPTEKGNIITFSDTTTDEAIFYQPDDFVGYSHIQGMHKKFDEKIGRNHYLFIVAAFRSAVRGKYNYGSKFNRTNAAKEKIQLPTVTKNGKPQIAFDFIEKFITALNAERLASLNAERLATLNAYLTATGLNDYTLTDDEQAALDGLDSVNLGKFNLENLYGKSSRGRRLKSADRIDGGLPLVTAGEYDMGISAYIGNAVHVFEENTVTIDMFGSAKYRDYKYGADDHVAVVHTETLPKFASLYLTAAIHKSSYAGQFDYSRNFYASDADELNISLPINPDHTPNYDYMTLVISAMQKVVIKNVVDYLDMRIEKTGEILMNDLPVRC